MCALRVIFSASMLLPAFGCSDHISVVYGNNPAPVQTPQKQTSLSLAASATRAPIGSTLQLTATITPSDAQGGVVFTDSNGAGLRSELSSGKATVQFPTGSSNYPDVPALQIGTHFFTATFTGDADYRWAVSASAVLPIVVSDPSATCGLALSAQLFESGNITIDNASYEAVQPNQSAVCATNSGTSVTLHNPTISSAVSIKPYEDINGLGAAVLAYSASESMSYPVSVILDHGTITTTGVASPAVFASGAGATVSVLGTTITERGGWGLELGGTQISAGHTVAVGRNGRVKLNQATLTNGVSNNSLLALEGGGGIIEVDSSTLIGMSAAIIRGTGSLSFTNSTLNTPQSILFLQDADYLPNQTASLQITGGSFSYTGDENSPAFSISSGDETVNISLDGVTLQPSTMSMPVFLSVGSDLKHSNQATLSVNHQTLSGAMRVGGASTLSLVLANQSQWTGTCETNLASTPAFNLVLDASSTWNISGDCNLNKIEDTQGVSGTSISNIIGNGHTVTYIPSQNPLLAGKIYMLTNGGQLKPAS